jgi:hypothetical protein
MYYKMHSKPLGCCWEKNLQIVTITDPAKLEFFLQVRKSFIAFTGPTKFGTNFTYSYWCFAFHFYFQFHSDCSRSTILDSLSISHNIYDYLAFPHKLSRILFSFSVLHLFLLSSVLFHHRNKETHCLSTFL